MTPEARLLAQALLDHHRQACRSRINHDPDIDSCLISYGDLCERAGIPHLKATAGQFLREIAQRSQENGWPPLNSLAVNHDTRTPGRGYDGAPGCSLKNWRDQVNACLNFTDY